MRECFLYVCSVRDDVLVKVEHMLIDVFRCTRVGFN